MTNARIVLIGFVLVAAVSLGVAGQSTGAQGDVDSIQRLIAEYAKAVDDAEVTLVKQIWSNSPDVSFIHPQAKRPRGAGPYGRGTWFMRRCMAD
jgi:hypothetical protein